MTCSFHIEIPMRLVKRLTLDFGIETSSVIEVSNQSTRPFPETIFEGHGNLAL